MSKGARQIGFGPIATTRAMCPPGSLFDRYITQFQWVRSYIIRDGHLFLSTMADGAISEFEPLTDGDPGAAQH
jgi:para-nitrobenzyl esterase